MSAAPRQSTPGHVTRYEELRRHTVERQILTGRLGLAILLRQGLAAWVEQWSKVPAPAPSTERSRRSRSPLADSTSTDLINVLAAMALSQIPEVHA
ncbi:MAG: hypothetical protein GY725_00015 [bacterium]|nr:hypothetical protein [bacterium]